MILFQLRKNYTLLYERKVTIMNTKMDIYDVCLKVIYGAMSIICIGSAIVYAKESLGK